MMKNRDYVERIGLKSANQLRGKWIDKCLCMIPFRFAVEMVNRGWILRNTIIWWKPSCMPSSAKDRFTVDFEYVFFFVKNKKYWFEQQTEQAVTDLPVVRKPRSEPDNRLIKAQLDKDPWGSMGYTNGNRNKRTVWTINTKPYKEAHFATFPEKLVEPMIKAGCPESGIVLDIFAGAGTTGLVAKKLNRDFIGIELNPEYIEIANKRINESVKPSLFTVNERHR